MNIYLFFRLQLERIRAKPAQAHSPGSKKPTLSQLDSKRKI